MSYTKNTWQTGDIVTAEKMNHIEQGIANGSIFVIEGVVAEELYNEENNSYYGMFTTNKSIDEVKTAYENGQVLLFKVNLRNIGTEKIVAFIGYHFVSSCDFSTLGDYICGCQQAVKISIQNDAIDFETAMISYFESGDPEDPNGAWGYEYYSANVARSNG